MGVIMQTLVCLYSLEGTVLCRPDLLLFWEWPNLLLAVPFLPLSPERAAVLQQCYCFRYSWAFEVPRRRVWGPWNSTLGMAVGLLLQESIQKSVRHGWLQVQRKTLSIFYCSEIPADHKFCLCCFCLLWCGWWWPASPFFSFLVFLTGTVHFSFLPTLVL